MLKFLRKNTKTIIWAVIIAFVLWGGFAVTTQFQDEGRIAGKVFGQEVTFQEFDRFFRASQIFSYAEEPITDPEQLKQKTWEGIIFSREAKRLKLRVTDGEVREEVLRLLKTRGLENPPPGLYKRWLQNTLRETPQEFESQVRETLRIQKMLLELFPEGTQGTTKPEAPNEKILDWSRDLFTRARLEDYLPSSAAPDTT